MNGLDLLGAEPLHAVRNLPWKRSVVSLAAGAVGALLSRKHPVLGFLGASAVASNVHAVAGGERTWRDALQRLGRHVVATAGSLAMPKHSAIGYVAGAVAADLFIDGDGGGIIEEWARYENISDAPRSVIDAEFSEVKPASKALVKQ